MDATLVFLTTWLLIVQQQIVSLTLLNDLEQRVHLGSLIYYWIFHFIFFFTDPVSRNFLSNSKLYLQWPCRSVIIQQLASSLYSFIVCKQKEMISILSVSEKTIITLNKLLFMKFKYLVSKWIKLIEFDKMFLTTKASAIWDIGILILLKYELLF